MTVRPFLVASLAGLVAAACATAPPPRATPAPTPPPARSTLTGASLGPVLGGRRSRGETAGVAPVAGDVAAYAGRLEAELRARTAGTAVEVLRRGGNIDLRMLSGAAFDFNAASVKASFRPVLDGIARTLASYRATFVDVAGHTDAVGTDAVNQKLSEERAFAVADYLSRLGVARARIATRGFGRTQPVASNADAEGRARNRRVELHISPIVDDDVRGR